MRNNIKESNVPKTRKFTGRTALLPVIWTSLLVLHFLWYNPIIENKEEQESTITDESDKKIDIYNSWPDFPLITTSWDNFNRDYTIKTFELMKKIELEIIHHKKEVLILEERLSLFSDKNFNKSLIKKWQKEIKENQNNINKKEGEVFKMKAKVEKNNELFKAMAIMNEIYKWDTSYDFLWEEFYKDIILKNMSVFNKKTQKLLKKRIATIDEILKK